MYWNTVSPLLKKILTDLMQEKTFASFRLVGGTALSLQYGHRMSVYIDLFSDVEYGTLNFEKANGDFNPVCLLNKEWELIKLDFYELLN